jgi:hypothetical protein
MWLIGTVALRTHLHQLMCTLHELVAVLNLQCGTTPGWLEVFTKCAETLEAVQKGIEYYLETKRVAFPRLAVFSGADCETIFLLLWLCDISCWSPCVVHHCDTNDA